MLSIVPGQGTNTTAAAFDTLYDLLRKEPLHGNECNQRDLLERGPRSRREDPRRLLGRVVWPVPRRRAGPRPHRGRAPGEGRQGQYRRAAGSRAALRRGVDPLHGAVRERRASGVRRRGDAEGLAREGARARRGRGLTLVEAGAHASALTFSSCGTGDAARAAGSSGSDSTRIPCTYVIAPPSQPPADSATKPISVRTNAPVVTARSA